MQIPVSLWILGLGLLFILLIAVVGVDYTIPMFVRANFDDVCNSYLAIIERDGGLDNSHRNGLRAELNTLGITNVTIDAPASASWGQKVTLRIEGDYTFDTTRSDLSKASITKRIVYENSTVILSNN